MKLLKIFLLISSVNSFSLPNINKKNVYRNFKSTRINSVNPVNGFEIGIPLNMIENVFTNLHYGYDITTAKMVFLQFLIGYYTYGKDRYKDALEYFKEPYETNKKDLYDILVKYKRTYKLTYCIAFISISCLLLFDENNIYNLPFILLLYSSEYYKDLKQTYPYMKPIYVSIMWTITTIILPCVLNDNNYSILLSPEDYLPCTLSLFAMTNLADLKDVNEDRINKIKTIPVEYGEDFTNYIVLFSLALSSIIFGLNKNYLNRPIINSLFEIQNAGVSVIPLLFKNSSNVN